MKLRLIALIFLSSLAHADDFAAEKEQYLKEHPQVYNKEITLEADTYRSGLPGSSGVGVRPVLDFDLFVNPSNTGSQALAAWNVGGSFSDYTISDGIQIRRTDLTLHGGYWFFHRTLGVLAKLGTTDTSSDGFDSNSATHFGAEIKYRIPIAERINLIFNAGWTHYGSTTLDHDTGIPLTDDPFENAVCSIITFGISSGCGDQITTLNVPASNMIDVGVGIAFLF